MAPPAVSAPPTEAAGLFALLTAFPGRTAYAARIALVCALAVLVTQIYRTPEPALIAYIVFFINKPDRMGSVISSVAVLILMTLVIAMVLGLALLVIDAPLWRVTCIALVSFTFLFAASASKLAGIGGTVGMIIGYALDSLGGIQSGEVATRGLLYAWLFAAIPAAASVAVNLLFAPAPHRLASRALAQRLRLAADALRGLPQACPMLAATLTEGDTEIAGWLKLAAAEKTVPAADLAALRQANQSTTVILLMTQMLISTEVPSLPATALQPLTATLEEMAGILEAGGYPIEIALDLPAVSVETPQSAALARLRAAIVDFSTMARTAREQQSTPIEKGGFFTADAFTNPEHVRYALKTTGAAMFCFLLYMQLDWPGIHTCFITCYVVALSTAAETVEKLSLRIAGCFIGAAAGVATIVFLMPSISSIGGLLAVVYGGAFAAAWVAVGSPRIAYAGLQIAFAFFLCVIQGSAPGFDLVLARDRIIGILLGNLVVYLVFTCIWPVSVTARIDHALVALLRQLAALAVSTPPYPELAATALTQRGRIEQDLALTRYEPAALRPGEDWIAPRASALREMAALEGPLLLMAGTPTGVSTAASLRQIADDLEAGTPAQSPASPADGSLLTTLATAHLARLRLCIPLEPHAPESTHAPV